MSACHVTEKSQSCLSNKELWDSAIGNIRSTTSCGLFGLIQLKVLHRVHFSNMDKCPCHLSHMFFHCLNLQHFWLGYFDTMSKVLGVNLCPLIAIFGITKGLVTLTTIQKNITAFSSLVARHTLEICLQPLDL